MGPEEVIDKAAAEGNFDFIIRTFVNPGTSNKCLKHVEYVFNLYISKGHCTEINKLLIYYLLEEKNAKCIRILANINHGEHEIEVINAIIKSISFDNVFMDKYAAGYLRCHYIRNKEVQKTIPGLIEICYRRYGIRQRDDMQAHEYTCALLDELQSEKCFKLEEKYKIMLANRWEKPELNYQHFDL
jgi:hypothetical protein